MISVAAMTHVGLVRSANEDTLLLPGLISVNALPAPIELNYPGGDGPLTFAVADGMGGHRGGQLASRLATQALADSTSNDAGEKLAEANKFLYDAMTVQPELSGMGTTIAGVTIEGSRATIFNVGDARVYQQSGAYAMLVTSDDRQSPDSSIVTQSIGGAHRLTLVEPHIVQLDLRDGDRLLLCSDGLSEMVSFDAIQSALTSLPIANVVEVLLASTLNNGGRDNVSLIVIEWHADE